MKFIKLAEGSFDNNNVVFVFVMLPLPLVAEMGCVILLWHSLGLPYNYFEISTETEVSPEAGRRLNAIMF